MATLPISLRVLLENLLRNEDGFSVGREVSYGLSITGGSTTSYAGTVGAIDQSHFAEHRYGFGLFSYVYEAPNGRAFDVVNYWVE